MSNLATPSAEAELREQAERLSLALSAGAMGTWDWDLKTNALIWDAKQFELFGIRPEDFDHSVEQAMAAIHPDDRSRTQQAVARSRDQGTPFHEEFRVVHPDGSVRWLAGLGRPLTNAKGETIRMIGVHFDISDRKRAEEKLKDLNASLETQIAERTQAAYEREERLRAVLTTAADAIITINVNGIIQTVNAATERLFGYNADEMVGQNVTMLMPSADREQHDSYLENYQKTGVKKIIGIGGEAEAQRKDGSTFPVELSVSEVDHLKLYTGIVRDITRRKQAEAALHESERFARSTLDALSAHIAIVGADGIIVAVNQAWRDFATANGGNLSTLVEGADYLGTCDRSTGLYAKEGPLVAKGMRAVLTGQRTDFFLEYPCHSPSEERWFVVRVTPFPGEGPRRVVVAHENITKRKELEREVVEIASLAQRRIGQDLHDSVGQELTALNMLAGDLLGVLQTDPPHGMELVKQIAQGLRRSQTELRAVMRGLLPVAVDAEGLMSALADLADRTQREGKVSCRFECPEPVSVADNLTATHLYLIAQEAVHNAVKHARPRSIQIELEAEKMLSLRVRDDGIGITQDPSDVQGGLGLRIMRNRAAIIGATLMIQPAEPTGTRVTCILARLHRETILDRSAEIPSA